MDECGECDGDGTTCADCEGVPNGPAILDECGICGGDGSSCGNIFFTKKLLYVDISSYCKRDILHYTVKFLNSCTSVHRITKLLEN